jgi:hypothetical protein
MGVLDEHGRPIVDPSRNLKNVEQGAATSVWCATSPQLDGMGGVYCENCDIAPPARKEVAESRPAATPGTLGVVAHAVDPVAGERLWELSERLVGLKA